MKLPQPVLTAILSIGLFAAPIAGEAQPALEQFRFEPSRLCLRDTLRWGFSYLRELGVGPVCPAAVRGHLCGVQTLGYQGREPSAR
jgi:hypothetical protein